MYIAILRIIYQTFIKQTTVIRAASWPRYIDLCVACSTHEPLLHTRMQDGFSLARMSPLLRRLTAQMNSHSFIMPTAILFTSTKHNYKLLELRRFMNIMRQTKP